MAVKIQRQNDRSRVWVAPIIEPEQETAIERMIEEFTVGTMGVVNASNMDTGKTLQASEVVHRMGLDRVLYIGVKDTYHQWAERLALQSDGAIQLVRLDGTKAGKAAWVDAFGDRTTNPKPGHYFVGSQFLYSQDWETRTVQEGDPSRELYKRDKKTGEIMKDDLDQPIPNTYRHHKKIFHRVRIQANPFDLIVFDEVHVVANRKSVARRTVMTVPHERVLLMSGTWVGNKFANAWSVTRLAWPEIIESNFEAWSSRWCETKGVLGPGGQPVLDGRGRPVRVVGQETEPGSFVKTLPCYIRIDGELEVPEAEIVYVDLLPEQRADYDDLVEDLMVWLHTPAGQRASLVADLPITLRQRLRTATLGVMSIDDETNEIMFADDTKSTKLHALRGIVDRPEWADQQVGIYLSSKRFAKVVVARMRAAGYNAVEWSGDVNSKEREEIKRQWLAGEIQYLVSVISAFSTGLDGFQAVCNKVVWLEESENNMLNQQAIKRYFRRGRAEGFEHVKIVARDTHDEGVMNKNVMETLAMNTTLALAA